MKLTLLREHYTSNNGLTWVPKQSFASLDEANTSLGIKPGQPSIYTIYNCKVCSNLHSSTKNRNTVK